MPAWTGVGSVFIAAGSVQLNVGDIQIGAVEIKNQSDDNRAAVIGSSLWTNNPPSAYTAGSIGAITSGTVGTVLQKNFAGSFLLYGWSTTATSDCQATIVNNTARVQTKRINIFSERNIGEKFISPIVFPAGSLILQAVHAETTSQSFEGTIFYHEI